MLDVKAIREFCKRHQYGFHLNGDDPVVILFGEGVNGQKPHNVVTLPPQEELIKLISPKKIYHEGAEPEFRGSKHTDRILEWEGEYGIPVALCDIPEGDYRDLKTKPGIECQIQRANMNVNIPRPEVAQQMMNPLREWVMGSLIADAVEQGEVPLYAGVGSGHVIPSSSIHDVLRLKEIDYITILQRTEIIDGLRQEANYFAVE